MMVNPAKAKAGAAEAAGEDGEGKGSTAERGLGNGKEGTEGPDRVEAEIEDDDCRSNSSSSGSDGEDSDIEGTTTTSSESISYKGKKRNSGSTEVQYASKYDKLDLSGLLNVLDGVVDTPGRIVVLTTNAVDVLDPALIRPGRVDKTILLGYMKYEAALAMTLHFFPEESAKGDLTNEQKGRLKAVFSKKSAALRRKAVTAMGGPSPSSSCFSGSGGELTPATVEQLLGEHDKVDDFLDALEGLAGP